MTRTLHFATVLLAASLGLSACGPPSGALPGAGRLQAVDELDLDRYLGTWYEIARYPNSFEEGLVACTATYELREDGDIRVINAGRKKTLDGPREEAIGRAWIPNLDEPAKLKVRFFWPFTGDYWVIALDEDYQWSIVGEPQRRYLWILARRPQLSPQLYVDLLQRIESQGYDVGRLQRTPQPFATD